MWTRGLNILFKSVFLLLDTHFNMLLSSNRRETAMSRCPTRRLRRCPRRSRCCCKAGRGRAGMVCEHHPSPHPRPKSQAAGRAPAPARARARARAVWPWVRFSEARLRRNHRSVRWEGQKRPSDFEQLTG